MSVNSVEISNKNSGNKRRKSIEYKRGSIILNDNNKVSNKKKRRHGINKNEKTKIQKYLKKTRKNKKNNDNKSKKKQKKNQKKKKKSNKKSKKTNKKDNNNKKSNKKLNKKSPKLTLDVPVTPATPNMSTYVNAPITPNMVLPPLTPNESIIVNTPATPNMLLAPITPNMSMICNGSITPNIMNAPITPSISMMRNIPESIPVTPNIMLTPVTPAASNISIIKNMPVTPNLSHNININIPATPNIMLAPITPAAGIIKPKFNDIDMFFDFLSDLSDLNNDTDSDSFGNTTNDYTNFNENQQNKSRSSEPELTINEDNKNNNDINKNNNNNNDSNKNKIEYDKVSYTVWVNNLLNMNISHNNLYTKLSDGVILCKILNILKPNCVDWKKKARNNPKHKFDRLNNCNYVVNLCKNIFKFKLDISGLNIVNNDEFYLDSLLWLLMRYFYKHCIITHNNSNDINNRSFSDSNDDISTTKTNTKNNYSNTCNYSNTDGLLGYNSSSSSQSDSFGNKPLDYILFNKSTTNNTSNELDIDSDTELTCDSSDNNLPKLINNNDESRIQFTIQSTKASQNSNKYFNYRYILSKRI